MPAGKHTSDAIEAIFAKDAGTELDCFSTTEAVYYYALLKALGPAKFNELYPGPISVKPGVGHDRTKPATLTSEPPKAFIMVKASSVADLLPGDWVYFKNFHDYAKQHPSGLWTGENAVYLGEGLFLGFFARFQRPLTERALNEKLVAQYNEGPATSQAITLDQLLRDGGGIQFDHVRRPVSAALP